MRKFLTLLPDIAAYFFVLLFCYASFSKILDFENFQVQLAQSPLLTAYAGVISYAVIGVELIICLLLCLKSSRLIGLYCSLGIMSAFTIYIFIILNYSDFVPCSCGGILEKLGWTEHMIFNIACIFLALFSILIVERQQTTALRKSLIDCGVMVLVSSGVVVIMFLSSEHIVKEENNFIRRFLPHPIVESGAYDLKVNSYYFVGIDNGMIYLGNVSSPLTFSKIDTGLSSFTQTKVHLDKSNYSYRNLQLQVKAPFFYLFDGTVPVIYKGRLNDSSAVEISSKDAFFTQLAVIDTVRFALRTQNSSNHQYTLASLNLRIKPKVQLHSTILEKQIDGVFDVDGKLIYDRSVSQLIYIYSYRNQFIILDSNFNILRKLNTVDTTNVAQIATVNLSGGKHKMNAPPFKVNNVATANRRILFNQSNLMGKHESTNAWKKSAVVDMYRTDRKEYIGSFYIAVKKADGISHLLATDKYLYVISGRELRRYQFRTSITDHYDKGEAENLQE